MPCTTARRYSKGSASIRRRRASAIFRLHDHMRRLYRLGQDLSHQDSVTRRAADQRACREVVRENGLMQRRVHAPDRVSRLRRDGRGAARSSQPARRVSRSVGMGLVPGAEGGLEQGVDVCVSSWQRVAPNTVPTLAKAGGNYLSSELDQLEAQAPRLRRRHRPERRRHVSEGAGENLFLIRDGMHLHAARRARRSCRASRATR